ncbi:MAG TPA: CBS domain-containing protein [Nanoarchaeota archaeon]|nr:CBS domain-containing protein [Nanoarchaeota archaeon]
MEYDLKAIQRRRKVLELTQHQLARAAEVSQSLIAKIENGSLNDVSHSVAVRILGTLAKLEHKEEKKAKDVMIKEIVTANPNEFVRDKIKTMKEKSISQLPVISKENVVGTISESNILDNLSKVNSKTKVSEIMAEAPPQVPGDTPISILAGLLRTNDCVLVTKKGNLVGIITKTDLLP